MPPPADPIGELTERGAARPALDPSGLRSQDALHLAVALRVGVGVVVTYAEAQAAAVRGAGLLVIRPG